MDEESKGRLSSLSPLDSWRLDKAMPLPVCRSNATRASSCSPDMPEDYTNDFAPQGRCDCRGEKLEGRRFWQWPAPRFALATKKNYPIIIPVKFVAMPARKPVFWMGS